MIKGAAGLKLETGVVWYPDQDLEEFEGDVVKVTIEKIRSGAGSGRIGFATTPVPENKKRKRKRRKG